MKSESKSVARFNITSRESRSQVYGLLSQGFACETNENPGDFVGTFRDKMQRAVKRLPPTYALTQELEELKSSLKAVSIPTSLKDELFSTVFAPENLSDFPPYETEYTSPHVFAKVHELADICGFYRAFGLQISSRMRERPDFIAVELEFMQVLIIKELLARINGLNEEADICQDAQRRFLALHLGRWSSAFSTSLRKTSSSSYYGALALFTASFVRQECDNLSVKPTELPLLGTRLPTPEAFSCPAENCGEKNCNA